MAAHPLDVIRFVGRNSKRIAVSVVGGVLVLAGLAMLVLPGPGILVIALGFAILGTEYAWAAAALERTRHTAEAAGRRAKRALRSATGRGRSGTDPSP
ncbi:MAG: PGPGW domain-containing protein [Acidimicrobiales bacterium]